MSEENKTRTKIDITAPVIYISEERNGYVTVAVKEDSGEYPTTIAIDFKGDKVNAKVGDVVQMSGYASSREYKGRYYTGIRGTWFKNIDSGAGSGASAKHTEPEENDPFDDEPF